jgi:hypothetical protein
MYCSFFFAFGAEKIIGCYQVSDSHFWTFNSTEAEERKVRSKKDEVFIVSGMC